MIQITPMTKASFWEILILATKYIWVRYFKKIQGWILKSERIRKRILRFFTKQINPRSLGSWCVKGTEESAKSVFGFFRF